MNSQSVALNHPQITHYLNVLSDHLPKLKKVMVVYWLQLAPCINLLLSPKDQFPGLQSKMRVVLRVEVEAVKFLKEEPHRLDALLKRCKTITDTLATMRKYDLVQQYLLGCLYSTKKTTLKSNSCLYTEFEILITL